MSFFTPDITNENEISQAYSAYAQARAQLQILSPAGQDAVVDALVAHGVQLRQAAQQEDTLIGSITGEQGVPSGALSDLMGWIQEAQARIALLKAQVDQASVDRANAAQSDPRLRINLDQPGEVFDQTFKTEVGNQAAKVGQAFQDVGEGVLGSLKLVKFLPWLLGAGAVLGLGLFIFRNVPKTGKG